MQNRVATVIASAAMSLAAASAQASTVTLDVIDTPNMALASAQIDGTEVNGTTNPEFDTGSFLMEDVNTFETFIAWCMEVETFIDFDAAQYQTQIALLSPERETLISRLFTGYADQTTTDVGAAAFQLAIWEIVEETSSALADLDLTNGRFTAASTEAGVLATANGFLANLGSFGANYSVQYFRNDNSQDLITASPVPLPASVLFLTAGIGALTLGARRKNKKDVAEQA